MSNEEKLKREAYRRKRNIRIIIQSVIIAVVTFAMLILIIPFNKYNQQSYVNYTENTTLNYNVYIDENNFYEEDKLPSGQSYLSEIIDYFEIEFSYKANLDSDDAMYAYDYQVEAHLEIISGTNGSSSLLYEHVKEEDPIHVSEKDIHIYQSEFEFNKKVQIDYDYYNNKALEYLNVYKPSNVTSVLIVNFTLDNDILLSGSTNVANKVTNVSLRIPLATTIVKPEIRGLSNSNSGDKILINQDLTMVNLFKGLVIGFGCLDVILIGILVAYILLTRNHDINYKNKVNNIIRLYKSFIQRILNSIDLNEYQVLYLGTITELLEIRDTLQMPILMYENDDKTCCQFMIPTEGKALYMYELKVDDYDELYNKESEEIVNYIEEEKEETVEGIEEVVPNTIIRHNYSFESRLVLSTEEQKDYYNKIVKFIKNYGVKVSRSWSRERIYIGRKTFATLQFRGKTLTIALPLDPKDESNKKYHFRDMSEVKQYKENPSLMRITSNRKVKYTIELLEKLFTEANIVNKNIEYKNIKIKVKSKKTLIKEGLIKIG